MKKIGLAIVLAISVCASAQQINPNQIRNVYVDTTAGNQDPITGFGSGGQQYFGIDSGVLGKGTGSWWNTGYGYKTLSACSGQTCDKDTAVGFGALQFGVNPRANTAIGLDAMSVMNNGLQNVAVGADAMISATGGATIGTVDSDNVAVGVHALFTQNLGGPNTAIGFESLFAVTTGAENTAVGFNSGRNTTGTGNTYVGHNSGFTGIGPYSQVVAVGDSALFTNNGNSNNAFGYSAGFFNTIGVNQNYFGTFAGQFGTDSQSNSAFGNFALQFDVHGNQNSAFGTSALQNTLSSLNTAVGYNAGNSNTTGSANIFLGAGAGFLNTTSSHQLYVGAQQATNAYVTDGWFGSGFSSDSAPVSFNFRTANGDGTNIAGSNEVLIPGASTGNAPGGTVQIQGCGSGSSGTSTNACTTAIITGGNASGAASQFLGSIRAGTGMQHKRAAGCTTAATAFSTCSQVLTWDVPFPDGNYSATCSVVNATGGSIPVISGLTYAPSSITVAMANLTAVAASGTFVCIAMHD